MSSRPAAPTLVVRVVTADDDLAALGQTVVDSYLALPGHPAEPDYDLSLADVAGRLRTNTVFGAFGGRVPLGCVTYVDDPANPHAEDLGPDEASFRMLGVAPHAQRRGVGTLLIERCFEQARVDGKRSVFIYSGEWMTAAHRVYERLGFRRVPERDWHLDEPAILLLGFEHPL